MYLKCVAEKLAEAGELLSEKLSCVYNALGKVFYNHACISGTVTDYESCKLIIDATVDTDFSYSSYFLDYHIMTYKNGKYSILLYNEDEKCKLTVDADGYSKVEISEVDIQASQNNTLDIRIIKQNDNSSLKGIIRNISNDVFENIRVG